MNINARNVAIVATVILGMGSITYWLAAEREEFVADNEATSNDALKLTVPALVQQIAADWGGTVTRSFVSGSGLVAHVVVVTDFDVRLIYSTLDGERVILGEVLSPDGVSLTRQQSQENTPEIDLSARFDALLASTVDSSLITGSKPSTLTVVYEPHCGFCRQFYKMTEGTDVQIRWIPVGFLSDDSSTVAAAMLAHKDQASEAMNLVQTPDGVRQFAAVTPSEVDLARIAENWAALQPLGVNGTPTLIWRDAEGEVSIRRSMVSSDELQAITKAALTGVQG